jgi:hypothetical protein
MSLIRGVLLAGQFRSQRDLNTMSHDDQRNTLIVVIAGRTKQTNLQSFNDSDLAGIGAVLVFLRTALIRSDADLKGLTADDMRNILIVELGAQTHMSGPALQAMNNIELVLLGLGKPPAGGQGSFIRGVLLAGQFRSQRDLNTMSHDDQRNTLIVVLSGRTNQPVSHFQSLNDDALAGTGAILLFLSKGGIRTDAQLKTISDDDQRNIAIVEIGAQTNLGSKLQGLSNLTLVLTALGVDPVFPPPPVIPRRFLISEVTSGSNVELIGDGFTASNQVHISYGFQTPGLDGVQENTFRTSDVLTNDS